MRARQMNLDNVTEKVKWLIQMDRGMMETGTLVWGMVLENSIQQWKTKLPFTKANGTMIWNMDLEMKNMNRLYSKSSIMLGDYGIMEA